MGEDNSPDDIENGENREEADEGMETNENSDGIDDDFEDMSPEEFQMINSQLDELNSALDDIEEKNDDIHARLIQLLQSNKEIRKAIQSEQNNHTEPTNL